MHRIQARLYLALAAGLLCTACVGNVAGPAEEPKAEDKELVSDVELERGDIAASGTALAKRAR